MSYDTHVPSHDHFSIMAYDPHNQSYDHSRLCHMTHMFCHMTILLMSSQYIFKCILYCTLYVSKDVQYFIFIYWYSALRSVQCCIL